MILNIEPQNEAIDCAEVKCPRLIYRRGSGEILLKILQSSQWDWDPGKMIIRMYCGSLGRHCKVKIKVKLFLYTL
jgi:hypothetical protein